MVRYVVLFVNVIMCVVRASGISRDCCLGRDQRILKLSGQLATQLYMYYFF